MNCNEYQQADAENSHWDEKMVFANYGNVVISSSGLGQRD